ncbi:hypothetical protein C9I90_04555 [Photobacterium aphoticum]|uniref:DUF3397 domain-containing protein n=1 Tax=Photobacterium aphoticum TaxID=754436 RepID=A0A0J1GI78_9GAMM|nr:hypothetical protein ABT58_19425 [Photobacterium aphoticum]PSU59033.1 hypothetical protein C9I90_04555 [Photobacterium aphoticum]
MIFFQIFFFILLSGVVFYYLASVTPGTKRTRLYVVHCFTTVSVILVVFYVQGSAIDTPIVKESVLPMALFISGLFVLGMGSDKIIRRIKPYISLRYYIPAYFFVYLCFAFIYMVLLTGISGS